MTPLSAAEKRIPKSLFIILRRLCQYLNPLNQDFILKIQYSETKTRHFERKTIGFAQKIVILQIPKLSGIQYYEN
jgi:hypothetical protein